MAKRRRGIGDVEYHVFGKKRPVAGSSVATSDFLAVVHVCTPLLRLTSSGPSWPTKASGSLTWMSSPYWMPTLRLATVATFHIGGKCCEIYV